MAQSLTNFSWHKSQLSTFQFGMSPDEREAAWLLKLKNTWLLPNFESLGGDFQIFCFSDLLRYFQIISVLYIQSCPCHGPENSS